MRFAHTNRLNGATATGNIAKYVIITLMTSSLVGVVAAADTYVIYPNDGSNTDQTGAIYQQLQGIVNGGDIFTSSSHQFGVNYWRTDFTSGDADTMKGNQDVSAEGYRLVVVSTNNTRLPLLNYPVNRTATTLPPFPCRTPNLNPPRMLDSNGVYRQLNPMLRTRWYSFPKNKANR